MTLRSVLMPEDAEGTPSYIFVAPSGAITGGYFSLNTSDECVRIVAPPHDLALRRVHEGNTLHIAFPTTTKNPRATNVAITAQELTEVACALVYCAGLTSVDHKTMPRPKIPGINRVAINEHTIDDQAVMLVSEIDSVTDLVTSAVTSDLCFGADAQDPERLFGCDIRWTHDLHVHHGESRLLFRVFTRASGTGASRWERTIALTEAQAMRMAEVFIIFATVAAEWETRSAEVQQAGA